MMELIESWLGALALLTEPFWLTLSALGDMIAAAGAGTVLVALFLLILALDFQRASTGALVPVSRAAVGGAALFLLASLVYGDFLAGPARAAYSAIVARGPSVPAQTVALTTLSAAGAGIFYYAGRKTAPRAATQRSSIQPRSYARREVRLADLNSASSLDPAGRLQLRQLSRNPKKASVTVRLASRSLPTTGQLTRTGRRIARGWSS